MDNTKYKISELEASIRNISKGRISLDRDILERSEKIKQLDEKLEGNRIVDLQLKRAQFEEAPGQCHKRNRVNDCYKRLNFKRNRYQCLK